MLCQQLRSDSGNLSLVFPQLCICGSKQSLSSEERHLWNLQHSGALPQQQQGLHVGTPGSGKSGSLLSILAQFLGKLYKSVETTRHQIKSHFSSGIQITCLKRNSVFLAQKANRDKGHSGTWQKAGQSKPGELSGQPASRCDVKSGFQGLGGLSSYQHIKQHFCASLQCSQGPGPPAGFLPFTEY